MSSLWITDRSQQDSSYGGDGWYKYIRGRCSGHPISSSTISSLFTYVVYLRELNFNGCANPFSRTDGDATSHPLGQLSTDGQPQPKAFRVAFSPVETLENVGKVGRAYPDSLIFHNHSARSCAELYIPTPARMLYSVAEQDQKHLIEPLRIGVHARSTLTFDTEPEPGTLYKRLHHPRCLLPCCLQIHNLQAGFPQ